MKTYIFLIAEKQVQITGRSLVECFSKAQAEFAGHTISVIGFVNEKA